MYTIHVLLFRAEISDLAGSMSSHSLNTLDENSPREQANRYRRANIACPKLDMKFLNKPNMVEQCEK